MRGFRFRSSLISDPREKPLDQSAIPLIAPNQLQLRLYQNIQNLDVSLIGSLEMSNVLKRRRTREKTSGTQGRAKLN